MDDRHCARALVLAPLVASGLALSGCMSSPTYGTDKTASEQLVGDLSNMMSFSPPKKEHIDYKPRPALVKPAPGEKEALQAFGDRVVDGLTRVQRTHRVLGHQLHAPPPRAQGPAVTAQR